MDEKHRTAPGGDTQPGQRQQPQRQGQPPQGSGDGISRRTLLLGGAGIAAAGAGGWYVFLRGPDGAAEIADEYVSAVASNDWDAAEELYHEEAEPIQAIENDDIEDYEAYLESSRGTNLDGLEEISPSVDDHLEWNHYPDYDEDAEDDTLVDVDPDITDEVIQTSTAVEVDVSALAAESDRADHLADGSTTEFFNFTIVRDRGGWALFDVFHPL